MICRLKAVGYELGRVSQQWVGQLLHYVRKKYSGMIQDKPYVICIDFPSILMAVAVAGKLPSDEYEF